MITPGPHKGATTFAIYNTTISENSASGQFKYDEQLGKDILHGARGGGLAVLPDPDFPLAGTVTITSTIIALNTVAAVGYGPDIWCADDTITLSSLIALDGKNNLVGVNGDPAADGSGRFGLETSVTPGTVLSPIDPLLDDLGLYGGPTKTYRLLANSPAIDRGDNPLGLSYDQRGFPYCREVEYNLNDQQFDPWADIGAFELQTRLPTVIKVETNNLPQQSMVTSIIVTFSEPVTLPSGVNAAFLLERIGPSTPTGWVNLNHTISGDSVTLTFAAGGTVGIDPAGSLMDGVYKLTIIGANVVGSLGQFDGNCDGVGGDNWDVVGTQDNKLFRLFGDIDGDGQVTASDFNEFRLAYGSLVGQPSYNFAFDYDGDGLIGATDYNQFRLRYGFDMFP